MMCSLIARRRQAATQRRTRNNYLTCFD
jgi:hypothetical protein